MLKLSLDNRLDSRMRPVSNAGSAEAAVELVIIANAKDVFYFRIFDADGKVVVNTDETRLTAQAGANRRSR